MTTLAQLRLDLAIAKASLRTAKDDEATAKVIATLEIAGKNDDERKRNAAFALVTDTNYQKALGHLRGCEYDVEAIEGRIDVELDAIRLRELQAREKLADALLGRRTDDAAADSTFSQIEVQQRAGYRPRPLVDDCELPY